MWPLEVFGYFEGHYSGCLVVEVKNIHAVFGVETRNFGMWYNGKGNFNPSVFSSDMNFRYLEGRSVFFSDFRTDAAMQYKKQNSSLFCTLTQVCVLAILSGERMYDEPPIGWIEPSTLPARSTATRVQPDPRDSNVEDSPGDGWFLDLSPRRYRPRKQNPSAPRSEINLLYDFVAVRCDSSHLHSRDKLPPNSPDKVTFVYNERTTWSNLDMVRYSE